MSTFPQNTVPQATASRRAPGAPPKTSREMEDECIIIPASLKPDEPMIEEETAKPVYQNMLLAPFPINEWEEQVTMKLRCSTTIADLLISGSFGLVVCEDKDSTALQTLASKCIDPKAPSPVLQMPNKFELATASPVPDPPKVTDSKKLFEDLMTKQQTSLVETIMGRLDDMKEGQGGDKRRTKVDVEPIWAKLKGIVASMANMQVQEDDKMQLNDENSVINLFTEDGTWWTRLNLWRAKGTQDRLNDDINRMITVPGFDVEYFIKTFASAFGETMTIYGSITGDKTIKDALFAKILNQVFMTKGITDIPTVTLLITTIHSLRVCSLTKF